MIPVFSSPAWMLQGACARTSNPDVFFPRSAEPSVDARMVCATCPIQMRCLNYAMDNREDHGIWGGLTEDERRSVRRDPSRLAALVVRLRSADPDTIATPLPRRRGQSRPTRTYSQLRALVGDVPLSEVRAWGRANGYRVDVRGCIPAEILEGYLAARESTAA